MNNNPVIDNSILGSKFLNPDYLFNQGVTFFSHVLTAKNLAIFYAVLSVFAIFFITIIIYSTIRMFE